MSPYSPITDRNLFVSTIPAIKCIFCWIAQRQNGWIPICPYGVNSCSNSTSDSQWRLSGSRFKLSNFRNVVVKSRSLTIDGCSGPPAVVGEWLVYGSQRRSRRNINAARTRNWLQRLLAVIWTFSAILLIESSYPVPLGPGQLAL